jgi:hypothetical protein
MWSTITWQQALPDRPSLVAARPCRPAGGELSRQTMGATSSMNIVGDIHIILMFVLLGILVLSNFLDHVFQVSATGLAQLRAQLNPMLADLEAIIRMWRQFRERLRR